MREQHTLNSFEIVKIRVNGYTRTGWKVTDHLCVIYHNPHDFNHLCFRVAIIQTGKLITGKIKTFSDAVNLAKTFAWVYREQIWLYEYEDWAYRNLPELARWTIDDGHTWMRVWNYVAKTGELLTFEMVQKLFVSIRSGAY